MSKSKRKTGGDRRRAGPALRILSFDIGGTHLKAALIDARGRMLSKKLRVPTPRPCPPRVLVDALVGLVRPFSKYDCIAIGFPGRIWHGRILTAPNLGGAEWEKFDLAHALSRRLRAPARIVNDAEMQGLGVVRGKGVEFVLTLGTGAGTALFRDGELMPHLEIAHHPVGKGDKTYEDYIGDAALKKDGRKRWSKHVARAVDLLFDLIYYDRIYIGGGNATKITVDLPKNATLVSNDAGIEGGAGLWRDAAGADAGRKIRQRRKR